MADGIDMPDAQHQSPEQVDSCVARSPTHLARLLQRSPVRDIDEVKAQASGRRESFLQERKDRLAQRRQQHGQVLARGRVDVSAKLEALRESLSAAQAARNAIYARIAANGSKELAKVQFVVAQNKEKLRLEREAKRLALELKLAEAEKRREAVLKRRSHGRRSASPPTSIPKVPCSTNDQPRVTPHEASLRIQRWWRARLVQRRVKHFMSLRLYYETVGGIPFEVIADVIKGSEVIDCSGRLLQALRIVNPSINQAEKSAICRVFLSTYMIVGHPRDILMREGPLEDQLVKEAKNFAAVFSRWLEGCAAGRFCCQSLVVKAWQSFNVAFEGWKRDDSANLVEVMVAQYCELDLIYQIVKQDSDPIVAAEYHTAIKDNQLMLLARIRRIAGDETRRLIRTAVLLARRKRLPRRPKSVKPDTSASLSDAVQFFSIGQRQTRLSNRQLIHELALNPAYQITKPELSAEDAASEESMKSNFFASLRAEMRAGRSVSWVPIVVQECKMRLLRLVMPESPTFKAITARFDLPTVETQCRHNSYDFMAFTVTVVAMMAALCSPARDALVSNIKTITAQDDIDLFTKRIDTIFEVLDVLLLDSANFHLSMSAAQLIPQAIPYEQKQTRQDLESGATTLIITTRWLQSARESLTSPTPRATFQQAFAVLCTTDIDMPETVALDERRVRDIRLSTHRVVRTAAHLMASQNLMRRKAQHMHSPWSSIAQRLLILSDSSDGAAVAAEINHALDGAYIGTESDRASRHATLQQLVSKDAATDPVQTLLMRRMQEFIRDACAGNTPSDTKLRSCGLADVSQPVRSVLSSITPVAQLHWSCYGSWYESILS